MVPTKPVTRVVLTRVIVAIVAVNMLFASLRGDWISVGLSILIGAVLVFQSFRFKALLMPNDPNGQKRPDDA